MWANNPNLYKELDFKNLIPRMENVGFINTGGRFVSVESQKIHKTPALSTEAVWIYVNPNKNMFCNEYQLIVKGFGFIPQRCLECYKVVIMPRSFHELMVLWELEEKVAIENPTFWCKCGIEKRDFVNRNYGGYFYCHGLEVGKQRYKTVRKLIDDNLSPDVNVILKRYCTEFELMFGPSDKYEQPPGALELEKWFWDNVEIQQDAYKQPEFIRQHVVQSWMMFAWGRGDKTVLLYNNGEPFFPPPITYHGE